MRTSPSLTLVTLNLYWATACRLLETVDPSSEDLAIAHYKLATFLYAHDMLQVPHTECSERAFHVKSIKVPEV